MELVDIDLFSAVSVSEEGEMFMFKKQVIYNLLTLCNLKTMTYSMSKKAYLFFRETNCLKRHVNLT